MATKKDLVEAYSFSRRRLITAFVSGAPGGREVEPNRPGRTIVGGVALAILLVAGAAVLGILKSPTVIDWDQAELVSDKDSGADYAVLDNEDGDRELRPIANITSAMLIFGSGVESLDVPRDEIAGQKLGAPIGILEAPVLPPETSNLIQGGWTACTGTGSGDEALGVKLNLSETPQVEAASGVGFVVVSEGRYYLVAEADAPDDERTSPRAFVYPVPGADAKSVLLNAAGTDVAVAVDVPPVWLGLFPEGGPLGLSSFGLTGKQIGTKSQAPVVGLPRRAATGDVLVFGDDRYVLTPDAVISLDDFSAEVYENLDFPARRAPNFDVVIEQSPASLAEAPAGTLTWPQEPVRANTSRDVCALLDTAPEQQPDVRLAITPGDDATAEGLDADDPPVATVEDGHGAFVLSGDFDSAGTSTFTLVDSRAIRYPVAGDVERENLGYGGEDDVVVPDAWLSLLTPGVPLSVDAARCPPTSRAQSAACGGAP